MEHIVVIGAGVIGLSTATCLQRAGYSVTIVAREFPVPFETADPKTYINYTSLWAGAHNRWILPTDEISLRDHAMSVATYGHLEEMVEQHPECGITFMKGIDYLEEPSDAYLELTPEKAQQLGIHEFRVMDAAELPDKVAFGCEYKTWCANPMVYCLFLLRQFSVNGGKSIRAELRSPLEACVLPGCKDVKIKAVINCSGAGFGDPDVFPTTGQTCVVANPCPVTITRRNTDGTGTFCVPRGFDGGTVIGGTKEPNNWDPEPSPQVRKDLLDRFATTYPSICAEGPFRVLQDIVGRRPTRRGGIRLEKEQCSAGNGQAVTVVHAYGLGGRGYELSWGVAQHVLQMLKQ